MSRYPGSLCRSCWGTGVSSARIEHRPEGDATTVKLCSRRCGADPSEALASMAELASLEVSRGAPPAYAPHKGRR